ncbi:MAG: 3-dehydroquinate synthase [Chloroflexi bacterium]|nr:3-dehydroquinate synthase [Chloroflexota bacterium]
MSEPTPTRIFLTGFSGTGKSTVAGLAAKELGWEALDTDTLIADRAGKSPAEIITSDGEERFRELERDAIKEAAARENVVVATGGGAVISKENRRAMAGGALVVCLEASPKTILDRLGESAAAGRPLLAASDPLGRITALKAQRQSLYALADTIVDTESQAAGEAATAVAEIARAGDAWCACHAERGLLPEERDRPPPDGPITITTASREYDAIVGWGVLDRLGGLMREAGLSGKAFVISDSDVLPRYGDRALISLREAGFEAAAFAIPAGEANKTLDVAATVYDWLVSQRAERGSALVALGGGVVGDLAGFVAATYLRGVPLVQAPTTVLAMVDASIGGKTAVDHKEGKNLIGAFYQPRLVIEDVSTLKTLPPRALVEGCAEVIKHALILDPVLLADLEERADDLLHLEPAFTVDIVRRNVAIKAGVVSEDERETGSRATLNYGHTVGHAIEAASGYSKVHHGEAISVGMMAAAEIGKRIGVTPPELVERQRTLIERFGLPVRGPKLSVDSVLEAITLDKKVKDGVVTWVLLEGAGQAVLRSDVPQDIVRDVVKELLS